MVDFLDMFDFVEGKVKDGKIGEIFESANMCNEIVVEIKFGQGRGKM